MPDDQPITESQIEYRAVSNLASVESERLSRPPEQVAVDLPPYAREEKKAWARGDFQGYHLTLVRGIDPTKRVGKNNPGVMFGGLIIDLDNVHLSKEQLTAHIERVIDERYRPQMVAKSFSSGFHLHFEFASEVPVGGKEVYAKFVETFIAKAGLASLPGKIDMKAVQDPAHLYEIGRDWSPVRSVPMADAVVSSIREAVMVHTRDRWQYTKDKDVPITEIRVILAGKYPDAPIDWAEFNIGQYHVRFYDPDATNINACRIYANGIYNWTKGDGFMPWSDERLCGAQAVQEILDLKIAAAVEGIYQFGKDYYRELSGRWEVETATSTKIALKSRGLSPVTPKGAFVSEVERALELINQTQRVVGVGPRLFRKSGPIRDKDGSLFLNTSRNGMVMPAEGIHEWGQGFPMIAEYFDTAFRPEGKAHLLYVLAHKLQGALAGFPSQSLGEILVGPPGVGKNFYARGIVGNLFGGVMDPQAFLLGMDNFNRDAFAKPVWYLSDIPSGLTRNQSRLFSDNLKKALADDTQKARAMYQEAVEITWHGLLIMACNDDSLSLDALPSTGALYDKLSFIEMTPCKMPRYPSDEELMSGELACLASYLSDLVIPEEFQEERFGVKPYHDPNLKGIVEAGDASTEREDMLMRVFGYMRHTWVDDPNVPLTASHVYEYAKNYPDEGFRSTFTSLFPSVAIMGKLLAKEARTDPRIKCTPRGQKGIKRGYVVEWSRF